MKTSFSLCVALFCAKLVISLMPVATRYAQSLVKLQTGAAIKSFRMLLQQSMNDDVDDDGLLEQLQAKYVPVNKFKFDDMDEEEVENLLRIEKNYLINKYKWAKGGDEKALCTKEELKAILRSILPPCSPKELDEEVEEVLKGVSDTASMDVNTFANYAIKNPFWEEAGPLVVKELIFLDCLNEYYYNKHNLLSDDDYNELKETLTWDGSDAVNLSGKEAHYISAVSASRRGESLMSDVEYNKLKSELQAENSWVVNRIQDHMEMLGVSTFMSYLHRSF